VAYNIYMPCDVILWWWKCRKLWKDANKGRLVWTGSGWRY